MIGSITSLGATSEVDRWLRVHIKATFTDLPRVTYLPISSYFFKLRSCQFCNLIENLAWQTCRHPETDAVFILKG